MIQCGLAPQGQRLGLIYQRSQSSQGQFSLPGLCPIGTRSLRHQIKLQGPVCDWPHRAFEASRLAVVSRRFVDEIRRGASSVNANDGSNGSFAAYAGGASRNLAYLLATNTYKRSAASSASLERSPFVSFTCAERAWPFMRLWQ